MSERYITPHELPSPYEAELLTILIEECAEVQQRATKILRFGVGESEPGPNADNQFRLSAEVGDLQCLIELCDKAELIDYNVMNEYQINKREKLKKYMQHQKED